ncbi:MAG: DUF1353 domain-containing protein [Bacteroidota bacterium]|nr:DUF1353 domain-containing protein [Bacteroidota bacterium]
MDWINFICDQLVIWWQFTTVGVLIIIGLIINLFGVDCKEDLIGFKYRVMPQLKPIRIPTAGKGFWGAIWMWLTGVRTWEVADDWAFKIGSTWYVIPQGFVFDGASIPKFLHTWLSPTGVLLMGGLVHDYAYKYATLLKSGKKKTMGTIDQKKADEIFRDINIEQNGFHFLNYLAYWALRIGGFVAWNKHRKTNAKIGD